MSGEFRGPRRQGFDSLGFKNCQQRVRMPLAIAVILLMVGTVLFHFLSPWWFTPIASNWTTMDDTVNLTFWVTGIVFVAINVFMAYAIIRYRHRKGVTAAAHYEPEDKKLEW